jgi:uncharacterized protein (DUF488 family)
LATTVWTIGHSTRSSEEFRRILAAHDIELVADVRRFPGSRRLPQFSSDVLETDLAASGILYRWIPELGGRRRADPDSVNRGWRNASFQAYADHVATEEFAEGIEELLMVANGVRTVVMCAEVLWWRCHRRLIADVLTMLGYHVLHIRNEQAPTLHRIGPPARLVGGKLTYAVGRASRDPDA